MSHKIVTIKQLADFMHSASFDATYSFAVDFDEDDPDLDNFCLSGANGWYGIKKTSLFDRSVALVGKWGFYPHAVIDLEYHESELFMELDKFIRNLEDGLGKNSSEEIKVLLEMQPETMPAHFDPETQIAIIWGIDDVHSVRSGLSDEQALLVLHEAKRRHDANIGINWDVLEIWADELFPEHEDEEGDHD